MNKDVQLNDKSSKTNYNEDIDREESGRDNQSRDTDPMIEKEGYLGVDDLDRMRRRHIKKFF